jgi:hypothetical protein
MEVWTVGGDDELHGVWWDGRKWRDWYSLGTPPGAALPPRAPLAAIIRPPDNMEV